MEAIHGRPSLWHNIISAGTIGYIGVRTGRFGVPFVNPMMIQYQYGVRPEVVAFGIYGGIAGALAGLLGGKPFWSNRQSKLTVNHLFERNWNVVARSGGFDQERRWKTTRIRELNVPIVLTPINLGGKRQ
jgi:hypothetical protein